MLLEAAVFLLAVALLYMKLTHRNKNLPPGEFGWPVIGAWPSSEKTMSEQVEELRKKHGDIFSWKIGSHLLVFLCDYKTIKTAMVRPDMNERPKQFSFDVFTDFKKLGVFFSNGIQWKTSRSFMLKHLKELGMGRSFLEDSIHFEAECLVKDFKKYCDRPVELPYSLDVAVLNVLWKMIANKRYEVDDPEIRTLGKLISETLQHGQNSAFLFDTMPWLIPITPNFIRERMGIIDLERKARMIDEFFTKSIDEHLQVYDPSKENMDYIDAYLTEMERRKDDPQTTYSMDDLRVTIFDMFSGGSVPGGLTINWTMLYFAKYPEVQAKAQKQIDEAVPRDRLPSLQDREKIPYLDAAINDIHRLISITPIGIAHGAAKDTELEGFFIPKNTFIMQYMAGCHTDPAHWEKPGEFYPEHFINAEGKFVAKKDGFLPFLVGRRACPAEPLARMELYLIVGALLQNFTFATPPGVELDVTPDPKMPVFTPPKPFKLIIMERK